MSVICETNSQSLFWIFHAFNMGIICQYLVQNPNYIQSSTDVRCSTWTSTVTMLSAILSFKSLMSAFRVFKRCDIRDLASQEMGKAWPFHRFSLYWIGDARTIKLVWLCAVFLEKHARLQFLQLQIDEQLLDVTVASAKKNSPIKWSWNRLVSMCSTAAWGCSDPDPKMRTLFVYLTWIVERSLVRKHDLPREFLVFVQVSQIRSIQIPYVLP